MPCIKLFQRICIIFLMLFLSFDLLYSQETYQDEDFKKNRRAAKYILSPGKGVLMMKVKIWGEVRNPGIYEVPSDIDLISLISSAGGPTSSARLSKIKLIRWQVSGDENKVVTVNLKEFIKTGDEKILPRVLPEDTIIVPANFLNLMSRILGYVSTVSSVTYFIVISYQNLRR